MKVLVGMSGGIDSSVAAYLLKKEGYEVEGVTMLIWKENSPFPVPAGNNSCYGPDKSKDLETIARVCSSLSIPHHIIDCSDIYEKAVLSRFREEYLAAHTPNPCIWCNREVKFGAMVERASELIDFDYFATGHYARIGKIGDRYAVLKAKDLRKDQSYFLSRLSQEQLARTLFPLGSYTKDQIRAIDEELGFHEPGSSESQDFYGGDYSVLLSTPDKTGDIVMADGRKVGEHKGYWHYTIGQRRGLNVAYTEPLYVIALDKDRNRVIVGTEEETHSTMLSASDAVYVGADHFDEGKTYQVKIRSTSPGADAEVMATADGFDMKFFSYVKGAAPGQSAVVYDGDTVIASGFIR